MPVSHQQVERCIPYRFFMPRSSNINRLLSIPFQRGYVLVSGRKFEELSRIEALLENEKSALREKCVWAFASDSTEASARGVNVTKCSSLNLNVLILCYCH